MKRLLVFLLLLCSLLASSQASILSGTLKDNQGRAVPNGQLSFKLVCGTKAYLQDGSDADPEIPVTISGTGKITGAVPDTDTVYCDGGANSYYQLRATSSTGKLLWVRNYKVNGNFNLDTALAMMVLPVRSYGMANPMTSPGDLIVGGPGGMPMRLGIGVGCLKGNGTSISWSTDCGSGGGSGVAGVSSFNSQTGDITYTPDWSGIANKPTTFTPTTHGHTKSQITDFPTTWDWNALTNKPSSFVPSAHNHAPAEVTGTALVVTDKSGNGAKVLSIDASPADGCVQISGGKAVSTGSACGSGGGGGSGTVSSGTAGQFAKYSVNGTTVLGASITEADVTNLTNDLAAKASTTSLTNHTGNTSNPHSVTAAQVGAIATTYLDTDIALTANSDMKLATQKAIKSYVDGRFGSSSQLWAVGFTYNSVPGGSMLLLDIVIPTYSPAATITIPANCSGSTFKAKYAATGSTLFTVAKNGTMICTATVAPGGMTATWDGTASSTTLTSDDELTIIGGGDATLSGLSMTIAGSRQ